MKILFLTVGDKGVASSRTRVYSYIPYLDKAGIKSSVIHYTPSWRSKVMLSMADENMAEKIAGRLYSAFVVLLLLVSSPFHDLVYIQKVYLSKFTLTILQALNRKIIFDFDDAVHLYKDIGYLLKNVRCIVVSNDYLKEAASRYNNRVYKLLSPVKVPEKRFFEKGDNIILGWIGSPETSKYLVPLLQVFRDLIKRFGNLKVIFMGAGNKELFRQAGIEVNDWSEEGERKFLEDIDIGIMPLDDDEWSRGKAGYKILLYMSAGIPCVASPVGMNTEILKDGVTGFFARSGEDWFDKLSILMKDAPLRKRMGQADSLLAEEKYSYEVIFPKFLDIIESC